MSPLMYPPEPDITINGVALTEAQALTVRVALSSFLLQLGDLEWSRQLGRVADGYRARAREVEALMLSTLR